MKMQESPEDYLEAILVLSRELGNVRSIDVANHLGYSKPSISVAMKRLRENGYVTLDDHGNLMLTGSGLSITKVADNTKWALVTANSTDGGATWSYSLDMDDDNVDALEAADFKVNVTDGQNQTKYYYIYTIYITSHKIGIK